MEKGAIRMPGFLAVLLFLILACGGFIGAATLPSDQVGPASGIWASVLVVLFIMLVSGLTVISPNESRVVQFFGRYIGTVKKAGFHWVLPFTKKRKVSLRVRNFETAKLKVSDADGNPVEIAAVVVYRVVETASAVFAVSDYVHYVTVQAEAAVRHLATSYPYESHDDGRPSLRDATVASAELTRELSERVKLAGVEVVESRITHLAYAPEIAQAMLARQQASAIVAARYKIVEGAVGMVSSALELLQQQSLVTLNEEHKAQMVANLLVVLCGDRSAQPVVNTGSLSG